MKYDVQHTFRIPQPLIHLFGVVILFFLTIPTHAQSGNYVVSGDEFVNLGALDLATPSGQEWATARGATPGYFSAVGVASFTGANDLSHINGYVKHYASVANQGFSFPVGSGTDYRELSVSGTRVASSVLSVAWIAGDPNTTNDPTGPSSGIHASTALGTGILGIGTAGQWDWQALTGSVAGLTVTVSIPNSSSLGNAADLRLVGWNGSQWVNLSGSTGASGNTENSTLTGTMIDGITALAVGLAGANAAGSLSCLKTQLLPAPVQGTAGQVVLLVSINTSSLGTFSPITVSGSGMTLANGVGSLTAINTGEQTYAIPLSYDGTALGNLNFAVGTTGSCVANLGQNSAKKHIIQQVWTLDCVPSVGPALR
ncbi:hypothetical protein GOQ04_25215 [Emticicia sp. ODNR4P]|nr:hypothetical protein [Emticicia sp. ODNR4P]